MASDAPPPKPRLPRGRSALEVGDRERAHRERLQEALVELVAERGFEATRIRDICTRAHVAPGDLYGQYPGKQELLLSTCDAIADDAYDSLQAALEGGPAPADVEQAVTDVLVPLARVAAARPAHASLVLVDVFSAGAVGPPYRRGLVARLTATLTERLAAVPGPGRLSEPSIAIVAAGALQVFERRVRAGRARSLPTVATELGAWAARYRTAAPLPLPRPRPGPPTADAPDRSQRLPRNTQRLPRQFVVPHQRERILRAVVELTARDGYAAISIPAIATEAQVSIRTFYQHFSSKHEAFTAIYDQAFGRLFGETWSAASGQASWPDAVREGMRAWAAYIAAEPALARFGFSDVLTAGREAVEKVDDGHYAFADLFGRGRPGELELSEVVAYAIAGGIGGLVGSWIVDGHADEVQQLVPHLVYAVLAPATGDAEALRVSGLAPAAAAIPVPTPTDDGQRIAIAFAALVAEHGYPAASLGAAARRAGIDPSRAGEYFADEADCTAQVLDDWADRIFTAMAAAFAAAPRDGALAVHRALGAMLAQLAAEPTLLALAIDAVDQLGPQIISRRARYTAILFEAVEASDGPDVPSDDARRVTETLVCAVLRRYAAEGRIGDLPEALPEISYLCVAPCFGPRRAADVSPLPFTAAGEASGPDAGRTVG